MVEVEVYGSNKVVVGVVHRRTVTPEDVRQTLPATLRLVDEEDQKRRFAEEQTATAVVEEEKDEETHATRIMFVCVFGGN